MAGTIHYDVAHGKPLHTSGDPDTHVTRTVDLLWQYRFSWIIIDRWAETGIHVPDEHDGDLNPLTSIEMSVDGELFKSIAVSAVILCSEKGSHGTHRSLQLMFSEEVPGRYIRITYRQPGWLLSVRAGLRPSQVASMETSPGIERMPVPNREMMIHNPLRAAILGDSNSVMRHGWVRGLASGGIRVNENVSLGSSSNAMLASRLPGIKDPNLDVLFINSTVNEYIPIRDRAYDLELSRQFVRHAQSWCARHDVLPVFMIYPQRRVLDDIAAGRQHFDQESYCLEMGEDLQIPYVNVFELARQLSKNWQRPLPSLYRDEAHLNHPTAQVLGAAIATSVWHLTRTSSPQIRSRVSEKHLTHDFRVVPLAGCVHDTGDSSVSSLSVRHVKTSIVDQEMVTIRGDGHLSVPIPEGWEVVGYTINARRCNSSIQISGDNTLRRRADFAGYEGAEGFPFVCVRSLTKPIAPVDGTVLISCLPPTSHHESDEITNGTPPSIRQSESEIEISELVIRERVRRNKYRRVSGIELDLTRATSLRFATR